MTSKRNRAKNISKTIVQEKGKLGFCAFSCWNPEDEKRREERGKTFRSLKLGIFPRFTLSLHIARNWLEETKTRVSLLVLLSIAAFTIGFARNRWFIQHRRHRYVIRIDQILTTRSLPSRISDLPPSPNDQGNGRRLMCGSVSLATSSCLVGRTFTTRLKSRGSRVPVKRPNTDEANPRRSLSLPGGPVDDAVRYRVEEGATLFNERSMDRIYDDVLRI